MTLGARVVPPLVQPERPRKPGLDALRAIAISLVVVMHLVPRAAWLPERAATVLAFGSSGVDLFFVLSGYLVGGIVLRELAPPSWRAVAGFFRRRAYRILPAYFVVLGLYLCTIPLPRDAPLPPLWPYAFFLQGYVGGPPQFYAVSWSLCIEEHFYLTLPLLLAILWAARIRKPAALASCLGALGVALAAWRTSLPMAEVDEKLTHFRTDGLLVGVALAAVERALPDGFRPVARPRWSIAAGGVVLATFAFALHPSIAGTRHWQPAIAVAFGGLVVLATCGERVLGWIGERSAVRWLARISYSLYLVHPLVFRSLEKAFFGRRWDEPLFACLYLVLALGGAFAAATLLHRFVEAPLLARRDRTERDAVSASTVRS